jgi:hypothetical protein
MTTPTLTSFAAPGGGAIRASGRPFGAMTTPTLTSFAAPGGGAIRASGRPFGAHTPW